MKKRVYTAFTFGTFPKHRFWMCGWEVQLFYRIGPLLILRFTKTGIDRRLAKPEPWVTPKLCFEFAAFVALASLSMIMCSLFEKW